MSSVEKIIITNPLSPRNLYNLLFHPSKLFAPNVFIRSKFWTAFVIFPFFGMDTIIYWFFYKEPSNVLFFNNFGNKSYFISWVIILLSSIFIWYVGGWFFNLRLKWCGAINYDKNEGRITMVYTSFAGYLFMLGNDFIFYNYYFSKLYIPLSSLFYSFIITYYSG